MESAISTKPAAEAISISDGADPGYMLLVQPGCSSCLRTKEFLARHEVPFTVVDITLDQRGMALLQSFGVRQIPIVVRGNEFAFGQDIADVARFVGIELPDTARLLPFDLMLRWMRVLGVAVEMTRRLPPPTLNERPIPGHSGTVRALAYHVFLIPQAFLDCIDRGVEDWDTNAMREPPGSLSSNALAQIGVAISDELSEWWKARGGVNPTETVNTFQGVKSLHWFLERSTWHSAQHTRQLEDVLDRRGIAVDTGLSVEDLEGLPLPQRIWQ
jgi:glutaredoxin